MGNFVFSRGEKVRASGEGKSKGKGKGKGEKKC
jgi:hypothetical protein